ncbi:MAG: flippase [Anaerolineales bacterium]|nr:flippase [Anaerolineales bacterium]
MARRVLQNSVLNLIAGISQRLGQTLLFIFIARLLTQDETGAFKLANTYASVLLTFSLWGLDHLLIREVAKNKERVNQYLTGYFGIRLILATALWLILAFIMPLLPYTADSKTLILLLTFTIIPSNLNNLYQAAWMALENIKKITLITLIFSLIRAFGGILLLWITQSVVQIAYLFIVAYLLELIANILITHRHPDFSRFSIPIVPSFWFTHFKIAFPLIIVSLVFIVEYQFDVVILSFYRPEREIGVYGTASTLVTLLLFGTRSFQLAVFPVISRAYHNQRGLAGIYIKSMAFIVSAALIVIFIMSIFSQSIIKIVFGTAYVTAGPILTILVWVLFFSAINVSNSRLMIAANKQRVMAIFASLSMSTSVLLSFWLVPRYGGIGSAWARLLAMPLYTIPTIIYVQKKLCPVTRKDIRNFITTDLFLRKSHG